MTTIDETLTKWERLATAKLNLDATIGERGRVWHRVRLTYPDTGETFIIPNTTRSSAIEAAGVLGQLLNCRHCLEAHVLGGPSHEGSPNCPMGKSIGSGGDTAHCSCDICF